MSFSRTSLRLGHAEVLALQQVVAGATEQLADGGEAEADHALAGARTERLRSAMGRSRNARSSSLIEVASKTGSSCHWWRRIGRVPGPSKKASRGFQRARSSPKFLLESNSCSVVSVRSPRVMMPIFCRQLRLRTESSKSVTGTLRICDSRS